MTRGNCDAQVLVLGATGKLGPHVVAALRGRGASVRAVGRDSARADAVLGTRATFVAADFADTAALVGEMERADAMLLLTPHGPRMADTQCALIDLAAKSGTRVVKVSGTSSGIRSDGPDACRQHYVAEQHLASSGIPWAVVRPNAFMQSLLPGMAASVRARGQISNPIGTAGLSLVDCADLGEAIAAVLIDPSHQGCCHVLTGPAAATYREIAAAITMETRKTVAVVDVTPTQAADAARAAGLGAWEAGHLEEMLALFAGGAAQYVTDEISALTGRPPRAVAEFVREHRDWFAASPPHPSEAAAPRPRKDTACAS
jgi:uncharacterized protein YbjT (DUF2867 family)